MKKSVGLKLLASMVLVFAISVTAKAHDNDQFFNHDRDWWDHYKDHYPSKPMKAPEIDLSLASGALTLLVGGALVILGRRQEA
ncbi:MAG TPA: hypothetical protein VFE02_18605 [Candidatus Acidoferrales bacterium]|nr:hypothetical protein [Candidatus Acidoferrales bacterium]